MVDKRTHGEIRDYLESGELAEVSIARVMYDHSVERIERLGCPELTALFKLLSARAFEFPFEKYNLKNLPMDFANLA